MKRSKFNKFVVDCYKVWQKGGNIAGILYGTISNYGFSSIINIDGLVATNCANMLYLKSNVDRLEADIYVFDFDDYKINNKDKTIYVKLKNGKEYLINF